MKIQIRKGLYETNSSSVHTLTIAKPGTKLDIPEGDTLRFGWTADGEKRTKSAIDECWWNDCSMLEDRLSMAYELCVTHDGYNTVSEFFERRNYIKSAFEKLGFKCEFNEDTEYLKSVDNSYSIFHWDVEMFNDEDFLMRFVFSDKTRFGSHDNNWYYNHDYVVKNEAEESGCDLYEYNDN